MQGDSEKLKVFVKKILKNILGLNYEKTLKINLMQFLTEIKF